MILLGIAIVIIPDLLVILGASFLIAGGIVLLMLAWRVRREKRGYDTFRRHILGW